MINLKYLIFAGLLLTPSLCYAQSTAVQSDIGNLTTTSCPGGGTPCFNQFSSANPLSVQQVPAPAGTGGAVNGYATATDTTSTSLIGAVTSKKIYLQGWACSNSGATAVFVTFQDGSGGSAISTPIEIPAGGGNNMASTGSSWGNTSTGNALFFAASGSTTTLYCGAIGFAQ